MLYGSRVLQARPCYLLPSNRVRTFSYESTVASTLHYYTFSSIRAVSSFLFSSFLFQRHKIHIVCSREITEFDKWNFYLQDRGRIVFRGYVRPSIARNI